MGSSWARYIALHAKNPPKSCDKRYLDRIRQGKAKLGDTLGTPSTKDPKSLNPQPSQAGVHVDGLLDLQVALHYMQLHCIMLGCIVISLLYSTILYYTVLCYAMLRYAMLCSAVLHCTV